MSNDFDLTDSDESNDTTDALVMALGGGAMTRDEVIDALLFPRHDDE